MGKLINGIVATATSAVLTVTGVNFAHNEENTDSNNNYCVVQQNICPRIRDCVEWAIGIANDPSHGYDQNNRWGLDYDCSSLVISSLKANGIDTGSATYTGNMCSELKDKGFSVYDFNYSQLQYGDIILWHDYSANNGHVELFIGDNQLVGAHINEKGEITGGEPGDQTENEISVGPYYDSDWQYILRYNPKPLDWLQIPDYDDDFYAFIESDNTVLAFDNDILFMEKETGNPKDKEIFHFLKEKKNCFTISNGSYSGSYNLYQDENGAVILHEAGSESSCLTSVFGTVINTEYDSCSDENRFKIRPVSNPIMVEYEYGGSFRPQIAESYGEPYKGTLDLIISGFSGWYTEREGGEKIDTTSKVLIPYNHTLYAHFDAVPEDTAKKGSSGGGRHDNEPTTESKTDEVAYDEDIVIPQDHSIYNPNIVTPDPVQYTPEPETEKSEIQVESINLNRYSKTLNTVGNSTSFTFNAEVSPSTAQNKNIHYESSNSSVCRVERNTGRIYAVSDGKCTIKAIADNGVTASCEVTVSTKYTTKTETVPVTTYKKVPESYDMECYCGRTIEGKIRQFYDHDISNQYDELGLSREYGQHHHQWTYTAAEVEAAAQISPGHHQGGKQDGANACSATAYSMLYGDAYYLFFIKNINYKTVETISYQTNTIRVPVEYD